jgi:hypothetical protein
MADLMILMVPSRSSTALITRSEASGWVMNWPALWSVIPVANSPWMARSCRSRAIAGGSKGAPTVPNP